MSRLIIAKDVLIVICEPTSEIGLWIELKHGYRSSSLFEKVCACHETSKATVCFRSPPNLVTRSISRIVSYAY